MKTNAAERRICCVVGVPHVLPCAAAAAACYRGTTSPRVSVSTNSTYRLYTPWPVAVTGRVACCCCGCRTVWLYSIASRHMFPSLSLSAHISFYSLGRSCESVFPMKVFQTAASFPAAFLLDLPQQAFIIFLGKKA